MTNANPAVYEAYEEEAKHIDLQELMSQMMESVNQEKGYAPTIRDEMTIRRMLLARKYIEKEKERLIFLKGAIMQEWDTRIAKEEEKIQDINGLVEKFLKDHNGGKKISLDVGTVTLRRSGPKVSLNDKEKAKAFLAEHNQLEAFLKAPELDSTLLQKAYMNQFEKIVEEEANKRIESYKAENGDKITKKKEGEIKLAVEKELAPAYFSQLPDFLDYQPESSSLAIKMK